jgi:uncharacterized membrane protein HdeD (DUF308 family)
VTLVRFALGVAGFIAGAWILADLPINDPFTGLVVGWTLLLSGLTIAAPALADLLGVGE